MTDHTTSKRRVFISHAQHDHEIASTIRKHLTADGFNVYGDWSLLPGDSIVERIERELMSSDIVLLLVSSSSVKSKWVQHEISTALSASLDARAVTMIPLLIDDSEIPAPLSDLVHLDLRGGLEQPLQQLKHTLGNLQKIDFASMNPFYFEQLVADLLVSAGHTLISTHEETAKDSGFDYIMSPSDSAEHWAVEVKLYRKQRVGVQLLHKLVGRITSSKQYRKCFIVTNGQLTSVARDFLANMHSNSQIEIRVIDGPDLQRMAIQHPDVLSKYFSSKKESGK